MYKRQDLTRPVPLVAAGVLALNDHVLKGAGLVPTAVTGKLSDVAGLLGAMSHKGNGRRAEEAMTRWLVVGLGLAVGLLILGIVLNIKKGMARSAAARARGSAPPQ